MHAWLVALAETVTELQEGRFTADNFEALVNDPEFRDTLMQAGRIAESTSREEKLDALRNAVLNSADSRTRPSEDERMRFLQIIDQMLPEHIEVMRTLPTGIGIGGTTLFSGLDIEPEMLDRLMQDLSDWQVAEAKLETRLTGDSGYLGNVTTWGEKFMKFVSEPIESEA